MRKVAFIVVSLVAFIVSLPAFAAKPIKPLPLPPIQKPGKPVPILPAPIKLR